MIEGASFPRPASLIASKGPPLIVQVRVFALLRERLGTPILSMELPDSATVGDLRRAIGALRPDFEGLSRSLLIAVGSVYAEDDRSIDPSTEIAAFPPVSGGSRH